MTLRLPFLILLFVICYLLFAVPSFAQKITPVITSLPQVNPPEASTWEDFLKTFISEQFRIIPDTLLDVNRSHLPQEVGDDIKNVDMPADKSNSYVKAQSNSDNRKLVVQGAYQYNVRSGIDLPSDVSHTSTNINNVFGGITDFYLYIAKIFTSGNEAADRSARKDLPSEMGETIINQKSAMNDSLSISQCGGLPDELCDRDNRINLQIQQ